jgi:hypothetical protein
MEQRPDGIEVVPREGERGQHQDSGQQRRTCAKGVHDEGDTQCHSMARGPPAEPVHDITAEGLV